MISLQASHRHLASLDLTFAILLGLRTPRDDGTPGLLDWPIPGPWRAIPQRPQSSFQVVGRLEAHRLDDDRWPELAVPPQGIIIRCSASSGVKMQDGIPRRQPCFQMHLLKGK